MTTTELRRVMTTTELKISEEPLADRVLRSGKLDETRLQPSAEKRARDVGKKLDRLAARQVGVIARFVRRITLRVAVGGERYARILAG